MRKTTKNATRVVALLASFAMVVSFAGGTTAPAELKADTVVNIGSNTAVPLGSTGYVRHDLSDKTTAVAKNMVKSYVPYENGELAAEGDYLKFTADEASETNGFRLDITSYVKKNPSGTLYGASLMLGVKDWEEDQPAKMFFEVTGENGGTYEVARATSTGDNTIIETDSNIMWYDHFLEGEAAIHYDSDSKIYLCVTQAGTVQGYDSVRLWGYPDEHADATDVFITTPELDDESKQVSMNFTNLTEEDKNLVIDIQDYEEDEVVGEDKYTVTIPSGMEDQDISLTADQGDVLNVTDEEGNTYYKDYKLGTYDWVSTWANAEEKANVDSNSMPNIDLEGTTYRQIIRVTTSGTKLRFRFSNQYGETPLELKSVHIAKQVEPTESEIDKTTDVALTFNGEESVEIPAGETLVSDPVEFHINALENIAVSTYFGEVPETITAHRGGRATMYLIEGNHVSNKTIDSNYNRKAWYYLCDCSILSPEGSKAVVCFGDSITDGYGTDASYLGKSPDSYTRWGDYFAKRLQAEGKEKISVLNEGIGANSMLGSYPTDRGIDRFERDLIEHDGVGYCIIHFGVNDIQKLSDTSKADLLIPEFKKMVDTCHKYGIKAYGAPILPFGTSVDYYSENSEKVRTMINDWMRSDESGFDGIIDFEHAVQDPDSEIPSILKAYTGTDGLHPYDGYDVMADAIDLSLFE